MGMSPARILIVEDESIVALDIESTVLSLGYQVAAVVSNATAAIKIANQSQVDLVLMDVRIKGTIDGIAAAQQLWQQFQLPVIFLTASTDQETLERMQAATTLGFISKPFRTEDLSTAIARALPQD